MSGAWAGRKATSARAMLALTLPRPCYRCGITIPSAADCKEMGIKWDVEHVVSRVEGGSDEVSSLSVSHSSCNRRAGAKLGHQRKANTKTVRAVESERTTKFWNSKINFEFFLKSLIALRVAPSFFVSELPHGGNS